MNCKIGIIIMCCIFLIGCNKNYLSSQGPMYEDITKEDNFLTIQLTSQFIHLFNKQTGKFDEDKIKRDLNIPRYLPKIGKGDVLNINIYETPPALFFGKDAFMGTNDNVAIFNISSVVVNENGDILLPFLKSIKAADKTTNQLAEEIRENLVGKANNPQVVVQVLNADSAYVTVLGDVKESKKVFLSQNIFTLLDVLAVSGIITPANKTMIQIDRQNERYVFLLETILKNTAYNINLQPQDIITVQHKTHSAVFLGASGKNEEIVFEASGITLAQGLGRVGGLNDDKANAKGLFIFRQNEDVNIINNLFNQKDINIYNNNKSVIYNINLSAPESFFILKNFIIKDSDIIYIATAPAVQYNKFMQIINSTISPIFMINRMAK